MATTELVTKFSFTGSLQPIEKFNEQVSMGITKAAKFAGGLAIAGFAFGGFNLKMVDQIDAQTDLAATLGTSVQALQEWGFVATLSGSSAQQYEASLGGLSQAIGDTANDVGRAKAIFEKLGISVKDSTGKVKSADTVMEELRGKLQGLEKTEKISILSKLGIDRSMLQMLESTDEDIAKLRKQAKLLGITTEEETKQVAEYKDSMDTLGYGINALTTKFQIALTPALRKMADTLTDFLTSGTIPKIMQGFYQFGEAGYRLIDNTIGINSALILLGGYLAWIQRAMIKTALVFAKSMILNPFAWVIAGVAALILIYEDLTHENSYLIKKFNELKDKATQYFTELGDKIKGVFEGVKNSIKGFIDDIIKFFEPLVNTVTGLLDSISSIKLSDLNPFSSEEPKPMVSPQGVITPNAISQNLVPNTITGQTLANTVNNNQKIEVNLLSDNPQTAGQNVVNALNQQLQDTNSTINKGGY